MPVESIVSVAATQPSSPGTRRGADHTAGRAVAGGWLALGGGLGAVEAAADGAASEGDATGDAGDAGDGAGLAWLPHAASRAADDRAISRRATTTGGRGLGMGDRVGVGASRRRLLPRRVILRRREARNPDPVVHLARRHRRHRPDARPRRAPGRRHRRRLDLGHGPLLPDPRRRPGRGPDARGLDHPRLPRRRTPRTPGSG